MAKGIPINHLTAVRFRAPWAFCCTADGYLVSSRLDWKESSGQTKCADASTEPHPLYSQLPSAFCFWKGEMEDGSCGKAKQKLCTLSPSKSFMAALLPGR